MLYLFVFALSIIATAVDASENVYGNELESCSQPGMALTGDCLPIG